MEQYLKYWCSPGYPGDPSNDPPVNWCRIFASTLDSKGGSSKVKRTRSISERRGLVEGQSSHTPSKSKASHHTEHQASSSHATNVKHPQKDLLSSNEQSLLQRADTIKLCSLEAFFFASINHSFWSHRMRQVSNHSPSFVRSQFRNWGPLSIRK